VTAKDIEVMAKRIVSEANAAANGQAGSNAVQQLSDHQVRIKPSSLIDGGATETLTRNRKRLRTAIIKHMEEAGWQCSEKTKTRTIWLDFTRC
jgi:hypothetical protein